MEIRTMFILRLMNLLSFSERQFENEFCETFHELDRVLNITPGEYVRAVKQKAMELSSGISLDNFLAEVDYSAKAL